MCWLKRWVRLGAKTQRLEGRDEPDIGKAREQGNTRGEEKKRAEIERE